MEDVALLSLILHLMECYFYDHFDEYKDRVCHITFDDENYSIRELDVELFNNLKERLEASNILNDVNNDWNDKDNFY